eukprot:6240856-Amphidinium_carterae.2
MLTKAVTRETLQRLRPIFGLMVFGRPGTSEVSAVSTTSCRKKDQKIRAKPLPRSDLGKNSSNTWKEDQSLT